MLLASTHENAASWVHRLRMMELNLVLKPEEQEQSLRDVTALMYRLDSSISVRKDCGLVSVTSVRHVYCIMCNHFHL